MAYAYQKLRTYVQCHGVQWVVTFPPGQVKEKAGLVALRVPAGGQESRTVALVSWQAAGEQFPRAEEPRFVRTSERRGHGSWFRSCSFWEYFLYIPQNEVSGVFHKLLCDLGSKRQILTATNNIPQPKMEVVRAFHRPILVCSSLEMTAIFVLSLFNTRAGDRRSQSGAVRCNGQTWEHSNNLERR